MSSTIMPLGLAVSKQAIQDFASTIVEAVQNGDVNPLDVQVQLKATEAAIKAVNDDKRYKSALLDEIAKYGKSCEYKGAAFSTMESGVKYDWKSTQDPVILELLQEQEEIAAKVKARQEYLKVVPAEGVDQLVGDEIVKIYPPAKSSTTTVVTKLNA